MSIPGVVAADLVLVEANLAFGGLESFLDGPAGTGDADQFAQRGGLGAVTQVVGQVTRIGQAASDQQPVAGGVFQRPDRCPGPAVEPWALGAGASGDPLPRLPTLLWKVR